MKKHLALLLMFFFIAGIAYGESKDADRWIKTMVNKLGVASSSAKEKKDKRSAVAGVKGAEEKTDEGLYWKKEGVSEKEADAFSAALKQAEEGNRDKAVEGLEAFLKEHPASPLANDAKEGIAALKGK
ncbi:MAG: hypothetical protein AAB356_08920 [Deltaproteobacteria bacterium]